MSRGVALNGKRTIVKGWSGVEGERKRKSASTVARDALYTYNCGERVLSLSWMLPYLSRVHHRRPVLSWLGSGVGLSANCKETGSWTHRATSGRSVGKYFETSISRETRVVSYAMGLRFTSSIAYLSFCPFVRCTRLSQRRSNGEETRRCSLGSFFFFFFGDFISSLLWRVWPSIFLVFGLSIFKELVSCVFLVRYVVKYRLLCGGVRANRCLSITGYISRPTTVSRLALAFGKGIRCKSV